MKFVVVFLLNAFSVAMADVFPVLDISHAAEKYYTLVKCYSQSQTKKNISQIPIAFSNSPEVSPRTSCKNAIEFTRTIIKTHTEKLTSTLHHVRQIIKPSLVYNIPEPVTRRITMPITFTTTHTIEKFIRSQVTDIFTTRLTETDLRIVTQTKPVIFPVTQTIFSTIDQLKTQTEVLVKFESRHDRDKMIYCAPTKRKTITQTMYRSKRQTYNSSCPSVKTITEFSMNPSYRTIFSQRASVSTKYIDMPTTQTEFKTEFSTISIYHNSMKLITALSVQKVYVPIYRTLTQKEVYSRKPIRKTTKTRVIFRKPTTIFPLTKTVTIFKASVFSIPITKTKTNVITIKALETMRSILSLTVTETIKKISISTKRIPQRRILTEISTITQTTTVPASRIPVKTQTVFIDSPFSLLSTMRPKIHSRIFKPLVESSRRRRIVMQEDVSVTTLTSHETVVFRQPVIFTQIK